MVLGMADHHRWVRFVSDIYSTPVRLSSVFIYWSFNGKYFCDIAPLHKVKVAIKKRTTPKKQELSQIEIYFMREWCAQFISQVVKHYPNTQSNIFDKIFCHSLQRDRFSKLYMASLKIVKNWAGSFVSYISLKLGLTPYTESNFQQHIRNSEENID